MAEDRGGWGEKLRLLPKGVYYVLATAAALVAVLTYVGITVSAGSSGNPSSSSSSSSSTTTTGRGKRPSPPPQPVYLMTLQPTGGDTPTRGDTQVLGQDFSHSIFYNNVGYSTDSASPDCQNSPEYHCVATTYSLDDKGFRRFTAFLGVTNSSPSSNENAMAHWRATVDGVVLQQGTFQSNSPPEPISLALGDGHSLELLISSNDPGLSETVNFTWGDAALQ